MTKFILSNLWIFMLTDLKQIDIFCTLTVDCYAKNSYNPAIILYIKYL